MTAYTSLPRIARAATPVVSASSSSVEAALRAKLRKMKQSGPLVCQCGAKAKPGRELRFLRRHPALCAVNAPKARRLSIPMLGPDGEVAA